MLWPKKIAWASGFRGDQGDDRRDLDWSDSKSTFIESMAYAWVQSQYCRTIPRVYDT
jgi:hypothetical protein